MKNTVLSKLLILSLVGFATAIANPVDFTTGFTTEASLGGQNGWEIDGALTVNTAGVNGNGFDHAILTTVSDTVSLGDEFTAQITFNYSVVADTNAGSPLLNVSFFDSADPTVSTGGDAAVHNRLNAAVVRSGNGLRIRLYQNWGSRSPAENGVDNVFAQSGVGSGLGLDYTGANDMSVDGDEDLDSDLLELTLTLTAGNDEDDWTAVATLRNVDTDTIVLTHSRSNLSFAAYGGSIFGGIGTGQGDGNVNVTARTITSYEYTYSPLSSQTDSVGFIASEGYGDGNINTSGDWSSQGDTLSDAAGTGIVTLDGFDSHIYQGLSGLYVEDATYQASIDFSFTDDATYTPPATPTDPITDIAPSNKPFLNVGIFNQASAFSTTGSFAVTAADILSNEALITTSADHGFSAGQTILLKSIGFVTTDPNGSIIIDTVPTPDSFTFALTGPDEIFTTSGSSSALDPAVATPQLRAGFSRVGGNYGIQLQSGWNRFANNVNALPFVGGAEQAIGALQVGGIDPLAVGIDRTSDMVATADLESDNLRLTLTLTPAGDNNTWDSLVEVFNLDSGTPETALASHTLTGITSFQASQLYGGFGAGQGDGNAKVSNRNIDNFTFGVTYPITVEPADIVITSISFDGTDVVVGFTASATTEYKLQSSLDLVTAFADTGETVSTDGSGVGTFTYTVPTPAAAKNFFQISSN